MRDPLAWLAAGRQLAQLASLSTRWPRRRPRRRRRRPRRRQKPPRAARRRTRLRGRREDKGLPAAADQGGRGQGEGCWRRRGDSDRPREEEREAEVRPVEAHPARKCARRAGDRGDRKGCRCSEWPAAAGGEAEGIGRAAREFLLRGAALTEAARREGARAAPQKVRQECAGRRVYAQRGAPTRWPPR